LQKLNEEAKILEEPSKKINKLMNEIEILKKKHNINDTGRGGQLMRSDKDDKESESEMNELKALNTNLTKKVWILSQKLNELKPGFSNILLDLKHNYLMETVQQVNIIGNY